MALSKNTQYVVAGLVVVYIVFFTRPAPRMVVGLLASPLAQIFALSALVYVGATQSLLVALLLAVAVVLSIPAREYQTNMTMADKVAANENVSKEDKEFYKEKCSGDARKENEDKCAGIEGLPKPTPTKKEPASAIESVKPSETKPKKETFANSEGGVLTGHPF
jgi:hypothetical protein